MFRKDQTTEESNFWISYADLMAGLLFVFILLIGAIVSKSIILKSDLHDKEDKLSSISQELKNRESTLDELSDTLAKSKALIGEKDIYLTENEKLLKLKDEQLEDDEEKLTAQEKVLLQKEALLKLKNERIASDENKLDANERMLKLKLDEINKLNKMLLAANARESQLSDKIIIMQDVKEDTLKKNKEAMDKSRKTLKDFEGKVLVLSNKLDDTQKSVKLKDEKLLEVLNALDEKKTNYDDLVANLQKQKAKIKSLTGIKLKVVAALKDALGENIDIDKKTGSLRLASNVLFGSGEDALKDEAKVALKKAFEEYIGTLVNDPAIRPHLDKIIIEGHTDSVGSYIYNLNLSQKRALAVMEYLITLDFTKIHNIRPLMTASGRAYIDLIKVNGVEDKDASRRIEIKFRLKNEDAINEIEKVLDAQ
ncbi:OmpA family protein [Sulfurovum sp.]|uniref:OmpA family protein n=1 Tax=Sulfurovum sp. TaxID=1969726 RepID=UPI002867C324|nr:OmpA family protein [Sulfurovum sp.]